MTTQSSNAGETHVSMSRWSNFLWSCLVFKPVWESVVPPALVLRHRRKHDVRHGVHVGGHSLSDANFVLHADHCVREELAFEMKWCRFRIVMVGSSCFAGSPVQPSQSSLSVQEVSEGHGDNSGGNRIMCTYGLLIIVRTRRRDTLVGVSQFYAGKARRGTETARRRDRAAVLAKYVGTPCLPR